MKEFAVRAFIVRLGLKGRAAMPVIAKFEDTQTVITTFEMTPGTCEDLLELLTSAYEEFISKQPGFIAAGLHVNDAQTRIANYSQWRQREDFLAMLRTSEMRTRNRQINELCKSFEPVMYEVAAVFG
jgi:quinol monooxygenase YgiN